MRTREVQGIVRDGERDATWRGAGEVVRRGRLRAETVGGRREIVQPLHIWDGTYSAAWAPFCSANCAARFGLQAFRRLHGEGLPAPQPAPAIAAPAERDEPRNLESRYGLLLQSVSSPEAEAPPAQAVQPGHPLWHPPGKPPPVPGVFRYDRGGYRISDTPEAVASRQARAAAAREARRLGRLAEGEAPRYGKRLPGQVNGHHA